MVRIKKNNFVYNKNIYQCIVPGCQNIDNDKNDPSIFYYIISENGLNQKLLINFLENIPIRPKVSRICSDHYTNDCFHLHKGVKMLKTDAVPTIRTKQNSTPALYKTNINRIDKADIASIENELIEKNKTTNDDKILMRPPQTTVVKKSQLQSIQRDTSILSSLLRSNKEVFQPHQNQNQESNENLQKQRQSKHLQIGREEKQLQQKHSKQELLKNRLQNGNLHHPQQVQHNGTLGQQPVLSSPQRQQKNNEELHKLDQHKQLCRRQQRKNNANLKKQQELKKSSQQDLSNEELKWVEQQKNLNERKQKLKQRKELIRIQQYNRNFSQSQKSVLSKHKQQQLQIEKLHQRPEQLWPQQQHQSNRYLQELLLTPPNQEQHYHQLLQRERSQNRHNKTLEEYKKLPQQEHYYQQFQNQKQQQYNEELQRQKQQYCNQELHYQHDHVPQQQIHPSNKVNLERSELSYEQQHQRDYKQMECEKEQQQQLSQSIYNGNISPQHRLLNEQQQSKSQTSSPIPHEEEHLIMCGYITFESCNNNFSYSCNFCSKNLENLNAFSAHLIRLHTNEIENEINSKTSNKDDRIAIKDYSKEINIEKLKCGIISISSKLYNLLLNCDFKFDCNFCDKKFEAINKFSEHIGKRHLNLLEKDKESDMEFEDDIEIDPSCILSFDQIDEINEFDISLNSTSIFNNNNNNNSNNKIVMSVPMTDNSEIFMTIDINENNTNNINHNNNNNFNKEIIEEKDNPMELDSLEKPKLKVHIKHSSWATRYFS